MPRSKRVDMANGVYHVTNRGVDRRNIVADNNDRMNWFRRLDEAATRYAWRVFAYALLDNHFHVFLRTPQPNLSIGMRDFQGDFAADFNRRHQRAGHLFQGRFHPVVVDAESHALELTRYIHLNPVRAGITRNPHADPWSSFRWYMDSRKAPNWLDWQTVLAQSTTHVATARIAYREFVLAGLTETLSNPIDAASDDGILGSDEFIANVRVALGWKGECGVTPRDVVTKVAAAMQVSPETVCERGRHQNMAREVAMLLCRENCSAGLEELAALFGGVFRSAVTDATRRCREKCKADAAFREFVERVRGDVIG